MHNEQLGIWELYVVRSAWKTLGSEPCSPQISEAQPRGCWNRTCGVSWYGCTKHRKLLRRTVDLYFPGSPTVHGHPPSPANTADVTAGGVPSIRQLRRNKQAAGMLLRVYLSAVQLHMRLAGSRARRATRAKRWQAWRMLSKGKMHTGRVLALGVCAQFGAWFLAMVMLWRRWKGCFDVSARPVGGKVCATVAQRSALQGLEVP